MPAAQQLNRRLKPCRARGSFSIVPVIWRQDLNSSPSLMAPIARLFCTARYLMKLNDPGFVHHWTSSFSVTSADSLSGYGAASSLGYLNLKNIWWGRLRRSHPTSLSIRGQIERILSVRSIWALKPCEPIYPPRNGGCGPTPRETRSRRNGTSVPVPSVMPMALGTPTFTWANMGN
jgi:hypothetical protein